MKNKSTLHYTCAIQRREDKNRRREWGEKGGGGIKILFSNMNTIESWIIIIIIGEVFKIGQPSDEELRSLSQKFMNLTLLGSMLGLPDYILSFAKLSGRGEEDKVYTMLTKWKGALGFRASYGELARVLDDLFIDGHNLIERYCHDIGK